MSSNHHHHPPFKQVEKDRPDFDFNHPLRFTKTPQPDWHVGQGKNKAKIRSEHVDEIDEDSSAVKTFIPYQNISAPDIYRLMISSIVPRPIGFCSTLSAEGRPNLAPFSYFNAAGSNPPCIMMSFTVNPNSIEKNTPENIRNTKQFVVAIISETFIEAANYTSIDAPKEVSEWLLSGLTPLKSLLVVPDGVKEAAINMECELEYLHEMFDPNDSKKLTQVIIIGRIKAWHIKEEVLVEKGATNPVISIDKLMPVSRLGGISYSRVLEPFELARPVWKEEKEKDQVKQLLLLSSSKSTSK